MRARRLWTFLLFFVSSLCPLCLCGESPAQLDPEINKPYHLKVVLSIADHPLLTGTGVFKRQIMRELRDGLQAAFGNMGTVEVTDKHPLLDAIAKQGLGPPLDELDKQRKVSDTKMHFVTIDFVNGRYEIQARQHDGLTGLVNPVIRHASTTDRPFVARTAALLIDRDLGIVGTLDAPQGDTVRVTLKGSGLGENMDRWVKKGDVFAVVRIYRTGAETGAEREPGTLFQVTQGPGASGVCVCRVFHRYRNPLGNPPYRCVKLGTTTAKVRLRLVDERSHPLQNVAATFSALDFDAKGAGRPDVQTSDADGFVESLLPYTGLVFVAIGDANAPKARIPIEIIGDRIVTCPIRAKAQDDDQDLHQRHRRQWANRLNDSIDLANHRSRDIRGLVSRKEYKTAADTARKARDELHEDIKNRTSELQQLRREAKELRVPDSELSDSGIRTLQEQASGLDTLIAKFGEALARQNSQERQDLLAQFASAQQAEKSADFEEAVELYLRVIKAAGERNEPKIKEQAEKLLNELKAALKPATDPNHQEAQRYFQKEWPSFTTAEQVQQDIKKAKRLAEVCKTKGDRLTLRRLLKANLALLKKFNDRVAKLDQTDPDDAKEYKLMLDTIDALAALTKEVSEFVQGKTEEVEEKQ